LDTIRLPMPIGGNVLDVGAVLFGGVRYFIYESDLGRQGGVGGVFDQLGGAARGVHQGPGSAQPAVDLAQARPPDIGRRVGFAVLSLDLVAGA
jgi:hypothetical protein